MDRLPVRVEKRQPARRLAALLLVGCGAGVWLAGLPALAQQGRKSAATFIVDSQLRLTPGIESRLEIGVGPKEAIPPKSLIIIRGVPASVRLSEARPYGPGVWVIPAAQLQSIRLLMPLDARVGGELTLALTTIEGVSVAEAQITLVTAPISESLANAVYPPAGRDDAPTASTHAAEQPSPAVPALSAEERRALLTLLQKGRDSFRHGNILHARQFYQRAAEKGLAEAALALAATYDPDELSRVSGVVGVVPDAELARKWYEKALQLGAPEAARRLSELGRH